MSVFDLFKRKKANSNLVPQENVSQKQHENVFDEIKQREMPSAEISQEVIKRIHPDLEGLIWIGDGKYKNYTQKPKKNVYFQENYITAAFMEYKINVDNINETEGIIDFDKNFRKYVSTYEKARNIEKDDITKAIIFYLKILGKTTPTGSSYWERPLILLERIKMYNEAYFICQRAAKVSRMPHVRMGDFDLRLARLAKKASDQ